MVQRSRFCASNAGRGRAKRATESREREIVLAQVEECWELGVLPTSRGRNRRQGGGGEGRGKVEVRRKRLNKDSCEESSVKSSPCPLQINQGRLLGGGDHT